MSTVEDFDVDVMDSEESEKESGVVISLTAVEKNDLRRKIEDILEQKRLKEEFGDLD